MSANKEVLAYADSITQITKHRFGVISQSDAAKTYTVQRVPYTNTWYCDCKWFHWAITRQDDINCYHIQACIQFRENNYDEKNIERPGVEFFCIKCKCTKFSKDGTPKMASGKRRQIYECTRCGFRSVLRNKAFLGQTTEPDIITESLNLYASGVSLRKLARHLEMTRSISIAHTTPNRWIKKFTAIMKEHIDELSPDFSNVACIDEAMINAKLVKKTGKGFYIWVWSILDPRTRYLIATRVSTRRKVKDAKSIIRDGKHAGMSPNYVITDRLKTYAPAIREEFHDRIAHLYTKSIKDGFTNRPVERWHNELRENLNTRRGLGSEESVQTMMEFLQIYHNWVKPHMGLDGKTPAQAAGLDTELGRDKFMGLVKDSTQKPDFVRALGKRIELVNIMTESGTTRVTQKGWIRKNVWREINDILGLYNFERVQFENESLWIRQDSAASKYD